MVQTVRNFTAGAAVTARRIVKLDSSDGVVIQAAAATDLLLGVSTGVDSDSGRPCDVIFSGFAWVKAGGTITRGQKVTADSAGKAVVANPDPTDTVSTIGTAIQSAVDGDEFEIFVERGSLSDADNS